MILLKTIIMENNILLNIIIVSFFSWSLHSQKVKLTNAEKKMKNIQLTFPISADIKSNSLRIIKYYKVVENINMNFGGYTLTYIVSDISLVNTNDLGPNNTRVVTPFFEQEERIINDRNNSINDSIQPTLNPYNLSIAKKLDLNENENLERSNGIAYIDILKTYERVVEKGYKSIDMLKKLGNAYYFIGQLDKAAKFYEDLFIMSSDLEPEYYFRYAQSLKSINKKVKADEMMMKFNQKTEAIK
jgi:tetratricopeptide (TPR) repeat protein